VSGRAVERLAHPGLEEERRHEHRDGNHHDADAEVRASFDSRLPNWVGSIEVPSLPVDPGAGRKKTPRIYVFSPNLVIAQG
jgi:hypothetical protein